MRKEYNKVDSMKMFLYALLTPQFFAVIVSIILGYIAETLPMSAEEFYNLKIINILSISLAEIGFIIALVLFHKNKNINIKEAMHLDFDKNKFDFKIILCFVGIVLVGLYGFSDFSYVLSKLLEMIGYKTSAGLGFDFNTIPNFIIGTLFFAFLPAVCEELIFRGVCFNGLRKKGIKFAVYMSAFMFALMHGSVEQFVYQFVVGVALAYIVYYTGSIVFSIILHFLNNFTIVFLQFILTYGKTVVEEESALPTTLTIGEIILALLFMLGAIEIIRLLVVTIKKRCIEKGIFDEKPETIDNATENTENTENIAQPQEMISTIETLNEQNDASGVNYSNDNEFDINKAKFQEIYLEKEYKMYLYISFIVGFIIWIANFVASF